MKCSYWAFVLLLSVEAAAQVRWTGQSSNGIWADPANWENGILPGALDDVLLDDNFVQTSYSIKLPDFAVTIRSLQVIPANFQTITVELPVSNLLSSPSGSLLDRAFTTTGNGFSFLLEKGAEFVNAAGSGSGYSLRLNDSLVIKNGARYIHRTRTGHADIVQMLSKSAGTEKGVFRFENPDAASTISLSGRVFGSLQLSASANINGTVSYSAAGTNPVRIRGNLEMEPGVGLAINFNDTIVIAGDLLLNNANFNMATGSRSSVVALGGNWQQSGGSIMESNTQQKTGTILLNGSSQQTIFCTGILTDSIVLDIMNQTGVVLLQPLRCPYGLRLRKGTLLTTAAQLLILAPRAWIQADSMAMQNFVDGPIKKEGLVNDYFLFPVGRNGRLRWVALKNATGNIQVEYHPASAYTISPNTGAGLDHLSQLEYWSVGNAVAASGQVELSFDHTFSGGVSELVSLRVAAFTAGTWSDAGNMATSGTAFLNGSVTSLPVTDLGMATRFFTLASSSSFTNVLPIWVTEQWMDHKMSGWSCNWKVGNTGGITSYAVEVSTDGVHFERIALCPAGQQQEYFRQSIPVSWHKGFCRITAIHANGHLEAGDIMRFGSGWKSAGQLSLLHSPGATYIQIGSDQNRRVLLELFDNAGRSVTTKYIQLYNGTTSCPITGKVMAGGLYWIRISSSGSVLLQQALLF